MTLHIAMKLECRKSARLLLWSAEHLMCLFCNDNGFPLRAGFSLSLDSISMPPKRERLLIKLHRHHLQADVVHVNIGTRLRAIGTHQPAEVYGRAPSHNRRMSTHFSHFNRASSHLQEILVWWGITKMIAHPSGVIGRLTGQGWARKCRSLHKHS